MRHHLTVGIAGLGFMGATHAEALIASGTSLGAVCARDPVLLGGDLRGVGGNLGFSFGHHDFSNLLRFRDWRDLVRSPEIDCVDICLPTYLHEDVSIAALRAGKHVLCEKPMAATAESCDSMLSEARGASRVLMIGHVLRFAPVYEYVIDAANDFRFGALISASFTRRCGLPSWSSWLPDETKSGGAILDLLIHDIDIALALCGKPSWIAAKSLGDVDTLAATLVYPGGPEIRIQGGWFPPEIAFSMSYRVQFERAAIEFARGEVRLETTSGAELVSLNPAVPYTREIDYFLDCCSNGRIPEKCQPNEARDAVHFAHLLQESRHRGGERISCLA